MVLDIKSIKFNTEIEKMSNLFVMTDFHKTGQGFVQCNNK